MALLEHEVDGIAKGIMKLDPEYDPDASKAHFGFPFKILLQGYLEDDDGYSLCFRVGDSGRDNMPVCEDFASSRGLSTREGVMEAAWVLVAYKDRAQQEKFEVVKVPSPNRKK